jgi:hypothetical protein
LLFVALLSLFSFLHYLLFWFVVLLGLCLFAYSYSECAKVLIISSPE